MSSHHSDQDELISQYYGSPTSTLSSGYGRQSFNRQQHRDDNLPEVAEVSSPQTATNLDAEYRRYYGESEAPSSPEKTDDSAKVVVPSEMNAGVQYPQTAVSTNMSVPWDSSTVAETGGAKSHASKEERSMAEDWSKDSRKEERKILGMSRKAFFILLAVILVIVVAAVGGGVGGAVAATRNKGSGGGGDAEAATTSAPPTSTSPPASTTSSTSSSASATPTFLNNSTESSGSDGFEFQGFSRDNYTGAVTKIIREEGGTDFDFDLHSYVWLPNVTSCCLSFCKNATKEGLTGWWCNKRFQEQASESFPRIFVWCGGERNQENAKCS